MDDRDEQLGAAARTLWQFTSRLCPSSNPEDLPPELRPVHIHAERAAALCAAERAYPGAMRDQESTASDEVQAAVSALWAVEPGSEAFEAIQQWEGELLQVALLLTTDDSAPKPT